MPIDSSFIAFNTLKTIELRTLGYLSDSPILNGHNGFKSLSSSANLTLCSLRASSGRKDALIEFQSYFDLLISKKCWRFHVGSKITNDYSFLTYYLAICEYNKTNSSYNIRRKYHFDYDNGKGVSRQPHPRYHLQYAGKKPSGMSDYGNDQYNLVLFPSLSEPRFTFTPMSMALLLNYVFIEFQNEITHKIIEDDQWRIMVKKNEEALLKPYYKNCWSLFDDHCNVHAHHSSNMLFSTDFCYGK